MKKSKKIEKWIELLRAEIGNPKTKEVELDRYVYNSITNGPTSVLTIKIRQVVLAEELSDHFEVGM